MIMAVGGAVVVVVGDVGAMNDGWLVTGGAGDGGGVCVCCGWWCGW